MKKVDQRYLHDPPDVIGDCFLASLASVLEWPIEYIPDFRKGMAFDEPSHFAAWNSKKIRWWSWFLSWAKRCDFYVYYYLADVVKDEYVIATGDSPRFDEMHAVVWKNGEVVHDPHPSRDGIVGDPVDFIYISEEDV